VIENFEGFFARIANGDDVLLLAQPFTDDLQGLGVLVHNQQVNLREENRGRRRRREIENEQPK
jgi:hypothetical protein